MIDDAGRRSDRQVVRRLRRGMNAHGAGKMCTKTHEQCEIADPTATHFTLDLPAHRSFRQQVGEPRRKSYPRPTDRPGIIFEDLTKRLVVGGGQVIGIREVRSTLLVLKGAD